MLKKQDYPVKYRSQAIRTIFAIIFFIIVYLVVLLLSIALVISLFYFSTKLIQYSDNNHLTFYSIVLFLFVDFIAIVLSVFIVKFFFRKSTVDRSGWLEINKEQQPKLFDLIESISKEIETNFPQKVYLGIGVDAMVFYDSNFRNLFFPSKENLMIGLGLVNSMNESELKAILAHEFGHFTQRSLNVYSYVYIENQVIYKMLIDEEYYQTLILKFSQFTGRFMWIVIGYSRLIRWVLRKAYEVVSKSYMALSREMEFHADEISAAVAGSLPAKTALLRLNLASDSFNYVWQFYYNSNSENIKSKNIYPQHKHVMLKFAERFGVNVENNLPHVTKEIISRFNRSKLVMVNQWASHPTIEDRVMKLEELNISSTVSVESAWNLFVDPKSVQKILSEKLFRYWQYQETPVNLSLEEFKERYLEDSDKHTFSKEYNHFYEFRNISHFELKKVFDSKQINGFNDFAEIYTDDNVDFILQFSGLDMDLKTVESISKKEIPIDSFEYDGIKYNSEQSKELLDELVKQHESLYKQVNELDINIFIFFYRLGKLSRKHEELVKNYETYFYFLTEDKSNLQIYLDLINSMQFIYRVHSFNKIAIKLEDMQEKENIFRERIQHILNDPNYQSIITEEQKEKLNTYLSKEWTYFDNQEYDQEALKVLEEAIYQFYEFCSRAPFYALKKLLDFQIEILENENPA
jgi:Zn-dependent protease with chaperone function